MTPEPFIGEDEESGRFMLVHIGLDAAREALSRRRTPTSLCLVGTDPSCLSALRTPRRLKDLSIEDWEAPIGGLSLDLPGVTMLSVARCHVADGSLWAACADLRFLSIQAGHIDTVDGFARPSKLKAIQCLGAVVGDTSGVAVCDRLVSLWLCRKASSVFTYCPKGALTSVTVRAWPYAELPCLRDATVLEELNLEGSLGVSLREIDHCVSLWYLRIGEATITEAPRGDALERLEIVSAEKARAPDWEWLGRLPALRYVDLRTVKDVPWAALEAAPSLQTLRISYEMLADPEGCRRFARARPEVQIQNGRHRTVIRPGESGGVA